jgi:hypothetical protein
VEWLKWQSACLSKCEALSSNPSNEEKKKNQNPLENFFWYWNLNSGLMLASQTQYNLSHSAKKDVAINFPDIVNSSRGAEGNACVT